MIKNPKRVDSVEIVVVVVVMVWQVLRFLHLRNGCPPYISREIQRIIAIILVKSLHHIKTHDSNLLDASSDDPIPHYTWRWSRHSSFSVVMFARSFVAALPLVHATPLSRSRRSHLAKYSST